MFELFRSGYHFTFEMSAALQRSASAVDRASLSFKLQDQAHHMAATYQVDQMNSISSLSYGASSQSQPEHSVDRARRSIWEAVRFTI